MISSTMPCSPDSASVFMSPSSTALNGCLSFHSGCAGAMRLDAVEREGELDVHRLFAPQRAVVVEGGDALVGGTKSGPPCVVTRSTNSYDRGLGRAVVPGRQLGAGRLRHC